MDTAMRGDGGFPPLGGAGGADRLEPWLPRRKEESDAKKTMDGLVNQLLKTLNQLPTSGNLGELRGQLQQKALVIKRDIDLDVAESPYEIAKKVGKLNDDVRKLIDRVSICSREKTAGSASELTDRTTVARIYSHVAIELSKFETTAGGTLPMIPTRGPSSSKKAVPPTPKKAAPVGLVKKPMMTEEEIAILVNKSTGAARSMWKGDFRLAIQSTVVRLVAKMALNRFSLDDLMNLEMLTEKLIQTEGKQFAKVIKEIMRLIEKPLLADDMIIEDKAKNGESRFCVTTQMATPLVAPYLDLKEMIGSLEKQLKHLEECEHRFVLTEALLEQTKDEIEAGIPVSVELLKGRRERFDKAQCDFEEAKAVFERNEIPMKKSAVATAVKPVVELHTGSIKEISKERVEKKQAQVQENDVVAQAPASSVSVDQPHKSPDSPDILTLKNKIGTFIEGEIVPFIKRAKQQYGLKDSLGGVKSIDNRALRGVLHNLKVDDGIDENYLLFLDDLCVLIEKGLKISKHIYIEDVTKITRSESFPEEDFQLLMTLEKYTTMYRDLLSEL